MSEICEDLNKLLSKRKRYNYAFNIDNIPNGIYILFEKGEKAHDVDRIVRVGTHRANAVLPLRLQEHFYHQRRHKSIFRKHIGRAILNAAEDPFIAIWNSKTPVVIAIDAQKCQEIEDRVTEYIRDKFSFVVFEVNNPIDRKDLEQKILSSVAQCTVCQPSPNWLGLNSPNVLINNSGLWNVQGLQGEMFTETEYKNFKIEYLG